jgi:hypothetical protein
MIVFTLYFLLLFTSLNKLKNLINNSKNPYKLIKMTKHSLKLKYSLLLTISLTVILAIDDRTAKSRGINREMILG